MYFYLQQGKQFLDLTGDLILSHNNAIIKARISSAAPRFAKNGRYILSIHRGSLRYKWRATLAAIRFIWGPSTELTIESIKKAESK